MNQFLFSLDIYLGFLIWFLIIFIFPILVVKIQNKHLLNLYFSIYLALLSFGVLMNVEISTNAIYFSLLVDSNRWFHGNIIVGYFNFITVILNIFLLFPVGFIYPIKLNHKKNTYVQILILSLVISLTIESLQFILPINRTLEILDNKNNLKVH